MMANTLSVSAQDGIVALGKACTRSAQSLSSLPKGALEKVPIFVRLNTDRSRLCRVECRPLPFSTPLSSGDQCCDALACLCPSGRLLTREASITLIVLF